MPMEAKSKNEQFTPIGPQETLKFEVDLHSGVKMHKSKVRIALLSRVSITNSLETSCAGT